ncbi:hypothetical protein DIPPA_02307 [Diplonema papillatum]|nr:hypothetical protein DIPPA_02307 [Diplonema papillatum]
MASSTLKAIALVCIILAFFSGRMSAPAAPIGRREVFVSHRQPNFESGGLELLKQFSALYGNNEADEVEAASVEESAVDAVAEESAEEESRTSEEKESAIPAKTATAPKLGSEFCQTNDDLFPGKLFMPNRRRKSWLPDHCKFRQLEYMNVPKCFAGKKLVFLGDSLTRDIVRKIARMALLQDKPMHWFTPEEKGPAYKDVSELGQVYGHFYNIKDNGKFEFYWSAAALYDGSLNYTRTQAAIAEADLVWIGSGAWDMGVLHVAPEKYFDLMSARVGRIAKMVKPGAEVVLFPMHWLHLERCPVGRKCRLCNSHAKAAVFRDALRTVAACHQLSVVETTGITKVAANFTKDGIHYDRDISLIQADVIVNHICSSFALSKPRACDVSAAKERWRQVPQAYVGCRAR